MFPSDQDRFYLRKFVKKHPNVFLFFDYDGTLVPLAATPDCARPPFCLLEKLGQLCALPGVRVAVVSGRGIGDLRNLLPVHGLYLVGVHGLVVAYPNGEVMFRGKGRKDAREWVTRLVRELEPILEEKKGFLLEDKGIALALHYRLAAPHEAVQVLRQVCREIKPLLQEAGFVLRNGKKVLEFRSAQGNKGDAVNFLLSQWPCAVPVYFGDDETDEDAFQVVAGKGCGVLVDRYPRQTAARYRLISPSEVMLLMEEIRSDRREFPRLSEV